MKLAKASEKDIDAAGEAMSVLNDISSGYDPQRDGDECGDMFFDEENPKHLRKFYNLMNATLEAAPGWPARVIGAMCYVILFDKNQIVDPDADVLELHPRFAQVAKERDELLAELERERESRKTAQMRLHDEYERRSKTGLQHNMEKSRLMRQRDELLAALKEARRWIGDGECSDGLAREHWTPEYLMAVDGIDTAIAKVEGGAA